MSHSNITICDFGTAPQQKADGFELSGFELTCNEDELDSLLRLAGEVRVVRGGQLSTGEECFHVMIKREEPRSVTVQNVVAQCESLSLDDKADREVLTQNINNALGFNAPSNNRKGH